MLRSPIAVAVAAVLCMPLQAWNGPAQAAASASLPADTPRTTRRHTIHRSRRLDDPGSTPSRDAQSS